MFSLAAGITDNAKALDQMARRAAFSAQPLFLKSCSRPTFLSFVREHLPALEADYAARFAKADFASTTYRRQMAALVGEACRRYGLAERSTDALLTRNAGGPRKQVGSDWGSSQQRLFA